MSRFATAVAALAGVALAFVDEGTAQQGIYIEDQSAFEATWNVNGENHTKSNDRIEKPSLRGSGPREWMDQQGRKLNEGPDASEEPEKGVFRSNKDLEEAVKLWCDDSDNATATYGDISTWKTSEVTSMAELFSGCLGNPDVSGWDVSQVQDMTLMFNGAVAFNGDISSWKPSQVQDMAFMFDGAVAFNGDISSWDTSEVRNMYYMFSGAKAFDQNLNAWNVAQVQDMRYMFNGAISFNNGGANLIWDTNEAKTYCMFGTRDDCRNDFNLNTVTTATQEYLGQTEPVEKRWQWLWANPFEAIFGLFR